MSDVPTAAEVIAKALGSWFQEEWPGEAMLYPSEIREGAQVALDALVAAFPYLVFDATDPAELERAGFQQLGWWKERDRRFNELWQLNPWPTDPSVKFAATPVWLAPERETTT